jgi:DNA-binding NtrC family response regulator
MALVVSGQESVLDSIERVLAGRGFRTLRARTASEALNHFQPHRDEIVLVIQDLELSPGAKDGLELLSEWRKEAPDVPVILLTEPETRLLPGKAAELGAIVILYKGVDLPERISASLDSVSALLDLVGENRSLRRETTRLKLQTFFYYENLKSKYRIVGASAALSRVLQEAEGIAHVPRPVLLRGERGTGKELVAAFIHYKSDRRDNPFITVNSAAFHGELLESEMFGHEKGAFTGADRLKVGRFELADTGTLFFDEIGNMSPDFQERILRAIEYQEFERVQGTETVKVDVRVVAATNANLEDMMDKGAFRRDLYDRLTFKVITVPPLRDRIEDVPLLVNYFSQQIVHDVPGIARRSFTPEAMKALEEHSWPGNVRELKYLVERLMCQASPEPITDQEVRSNIVYCPQPPPVQGSFDDRVEQFRKGLIEEALARCQFSQKDAASHLGITYDQFRYFYRKLFKQPAQSD